MRDGYKELAYVTLRRVDNSDEVKSLLNRMKQVNNGLADDLQELKKIEAFAEKAAKTADAIANVVGKVAERVASLAI